MKIRLDGKESEMPAMIEKMKQTFNVTYVSGFYRNRTKSGVSEYGRVYINIGNDNTPVAYNVD